ncbi:acetyl-coenzyme A carboxylase carboxyl transferase subunit beta [Clostridium zeae]|uniref:Acetyl-coenzyme A carboxylase carboxyl transferase subunit beta n=1 Tax=Clostridium zeae TaxID=2759022 RepID=A0ABQ1E7V0_9CLOT|nr:acetyl-CoA carboxylase, carboxyltransferase subunit beta [Clostridium zeae]GFZ30856.1 acetyl-coenzyme A carboxylase carboxyl transferase subunit beta [Clostridium zeae]
MDSLSRVMIKKGMWTKCKKCSNIIYTKELKENQSVCPKCSNHLRLSAKDRIDQIIDDGTFEEMHAEIETKNIFKFEGYDEKLKENKEKNSINEAVIIGCGNIHGIKVAIGVMDSNFMMGSMGTVVGEKIARLVEFSSKEKLPMVLFCTSGGARMQEGILSLMQMAKISFTLARFKEQGGLYISVLTDPTTGGVSASFAMQGDIIISEPNALIGFAGKKVIQNTIKEELPNDLQRAEFLFKKGLIDKIVNRKEMKKFLFDILDINKGIYYEPRK